MKKITFIILILCFAAASLPGRGPETLFLKSPEPVAVPSVSGEIRIDGSLDDKDWARAAKIELNYEIYPGDNVSPPVRTTAYLITDDENLYVGFEAFDPDVAKIRANYFDRDQIWNDDTAGIGIDTFNSGNRMFYFAANPHGIQGDEIFSKGGEYEDVSWDAIWYSNGRITENGYILEFRIPFNAIQFKGKKGKKEWGLLLFRSYPRSKRHQMTNSPQDKNNPCWICQLSKITGFDHVRPGKNIELDPTLTGIISGDRAGFPDGPMESEGLKMDPGLSGKWGISPNLNLSFALNPDFSQIEADAARLDINTQYALYYDEKRPFFLEGKDFFVTPMNALYTRSIADPDFGIKLSGKFHDHALGIFMTRDNKTNLIFPGVTGSEEATLEEKVWAGSFRYRYDFGRSSTIGILMTDREGDRYFNRMGGVDGLIRFSRSDSISFQLLGSSTQYPDELAAEYGQKKGIFTGTAFSVSLNHNERTWRANAGYTDYSPGFRADLGYIPQVGFRKVVLGGYYVFWGKNGGFLTSLTIGGDIDQTTGHDGNLIEREAQLVAAFEGPMQSMFSAEYEKRRYVYEGIVFDQDDITFEFFINPAKKLRFFVYYNFGDGIDYEHVRAGRRVYLSPSIRYNVNKHLEIFGESDISYFYVGDDYLFKAFLNEIKLVYFLNKKMFLRGILQFSDIRRNLELYADEADERERKVLTQFLFSYKLNPRTVLYLGYSDIYEAYNEMNLLRNNRSVFLKIGYALVM